MKKKPVHEAKPTPEAIVVKREQAEAEPLTMIDNTGKVPEKCSVCGDPRAPNSTEGLCWVCRRLKISAWRDSDPQLATQE